MDPVQKTFFCVFEKQRQRAGIVDSDTTYWNLASKEGTEGIVTSTSSLHRVTQLCGLWR